MHRARAATYRSPARRSRTCCKQLADARPHARRRSSAAGATATSSMPSPLARSGSARRPSATATCSQQIADAPAQRARAARGSAAASRRRSTSPQAGRAARDRSSRRSRGQRQRPRRTMLSLEFCALARVRGAPPPGDATCADAGRPPFTVVAGKRPHRDADLCRPRSRHVMASARKGLEIQRYKGLGEMNPEQLWATTMNPETRTLLAGARRGHARGRLIFSMLMGDEVEPRRKFIEAQRAQRAEPRHLRIRGARRSEPARR